MHRTLVMLEYENAVWEQGHTRVAGIDEAGRGPLAGPVVAAAVQMDAAYAQQALRTSLARVNDSKKLSPALREALFDTLMQDPLVQVGVGEAGVEEIDRLNILNATHLAMARAIEAIQPLPDVALVDGRPVKGLPLPHQAIVKGDSKSLLIAAASIIAKTHRDALLRQVAKAYPEYHFDRHKGYGTQRHLEALRAHGPCPEHRMSFRPVREAAEKVHV